MINLYLGVVNILVGGLHLAYGNKIVGAVSLVIGLILLTMEIEKLRG